MRVAARPTLIRLALIAAVATFCLLGSTGSTALAYKLPPDTSGEAYTPDNPDDISSISWGWYPAGYLSSFGIAEQVWVLQWRFQLGGLATSFLDMTGCPTGSPSYWWPDICSGIGSYSTERARNLAANEALGVGSDVPGRLAWRPACYQDGDFSMGCYIRWYPVSDATKPPPGRYGRCVRAGTGQLFGEEGHIRNPTGCLSDPVNTATGSYATAETDISLPGIGLPFQLTRTYNSADPTQGPLGVGWTHSYAPTLTTNQSEAILRAENGAVVHFYRRPDGSFKGEPGALSRLQTVSGGHELVRNDQVRYRFDASGRLTSLRDRNSNELELQYTSGVLSAIVDSTGRQITFEHGTDGRLNRIALPDGRDVEYAYTSGLLTSVTDLAGKTTAHEYDTSGRLAKTVTPEGRTLIENEYGSDGRVIKQIDGLGEESTFSWNPTTMTATMTDARGKVWADVYDPYFVLEKRVDPLENETAFDFDDALNPVAFTDARGHTTTSSFDERGNLLTRTTPAPSSYVETYTYDAQNNLLSSIDRLGHTTSYDHDTAGNVITITQPDPDWFGPGSDGPEVPPVTSFTRDPATGLLTELVDGRGKTTEFNHDAAGNLTEIRTPMGHETTFVFDGSGRPTSRVEPRGNLVGADPDDYRTTFTFDASDRLLSVTNPLGHETSYVYDDDGNQVSRTDAKNRTTTYSYNDAAELSALTAPDLTVTAYDYDASGNLSSRTDANNHTTAYAYDDANRLTAVTAPLGRELTYAYDAVGNVASRVDANGNTTTLDPDDGKATYTYNELNQLVGIDYDDATSDVWFSYNANGKLENFDGGWGSGGYYYDTLNRLTRHYHSGYSSNGSEEFRYTYDAAGNITSRTYPDSTAMAYTNDDDGRVTTVSNGGATTTYGYDEAGNLTSTSLPAGVGISESRTYDASGRLTDITTSKGANLLSQFEYTLDPVGNPSEVVSVGSALTPGTRRYDYDQLDRLSEVCYQQAACSGASDPFIRWTYDAVGNRTQEQRPNQTTTYTYNAADELTESLIGTAATSYTYDDNGNQLTAGADTFTYDRANKLTLAVADGVTAEYQYDALGMRVLSSATRFTYDENGEPISGEWDETFYVWDMNNQLPQLAYERNGDGTTKRHYVNGHRPISVTPRSTGDPSYYSFDRLGSITGVHSESGANEWSYDYEPYGSERTATKLDPAAPTNPLRFNAQHLDKETGRYHMRARQYDSTLGRFTQTDPLAPPKNEPFVSAYAYANNQPTLLVDPSGLRPEGDTSRCHDWGSGVAGLVNTAYGSWKMTAGMPLVIAGGAATFTVPVFGQVVGPIAFGWGVYQTTSGAGRWGRGAAQIVTTVQNEAPYGCSFQNQFSRTVNGVIPESLDLIGLLGGLP
jgi:RHS repeat-associated protein